MAAAAAAGAIIFSRRPATTPLQQVTMVVRPLEHEPLVVWVEQAKRWNRVSSRQG